MKQWLKTRAQRRKQKFHDKGFAFASALLLRNRAIAERQLDHFLRCNIPLCAEEQFYSDGIRHALQLWVELTNEIKGQ